MCENESLLPNWGNDASGIDAQTAQDWVDQTQGDCWLEPTWEFQ